MNWKNRIYVFTLCLTFSFGFGSISQCEELQADSAPGQTQLPLEFLNLTKCNSDPTFHVACRWISGQFQDWMPEDMRIVKQSLDLHQNLSTEQQLRGENFFRVLQSLGLKKIQFVYVIGGADQAETSMDSGTAIIALRPPFFQSHGMYDRVTEQQHALLHELFHVYLHFSSGDYNSDPFQRALAEALEWHYPNGMNSLVRTAAHSTEVAKYKKLRAAGSVQQAIATDLRFSRAVGFPSFYSMIKISEYLPELGSFLIHDSEMQSALPNTVINVLKRTPLKLLLDERLPAAPAPQAMRFFENTIQYEFVGKLFDQDDFRCTIFILKHGVAATAKHCIDRSWPINNSGNTQYSFLSMEFPKASGGRIRVDGMSITGVYKDSGPNDLAYFIYDAKATDGKIQVPILHFMREAHAYTKTTEALFTVGFALPTKIQNLRRLQSRACAFNGEAREMSDPRYQGLLYGATCPGSWGASGSPIFSAGAESGSLNLWGVLTHTFTTNLSGQHSDEWGPYTDINFSPTYLGKEFLQFD